MWMRALGASVSLDAVGAANEAASASAEHVWVRGRAARYGLVVIEGARWLEQAKLYQLDTGKIIEFESTEIERLQRENTELYPAAEQA